MSYHSGFLLAVPTANRQEYADHAAKSWPMFQKRGALRLLLGSETQHVLAQATVPVLVLR